jgi:hypothetical protein
VLLQRFCLYFDLQKVNAGPSHVQNCAEKLMNKASSQKQVTSAYIAGCEGGTTAVNANNN